MTRRKSRREEIQEEATALEIAYHGNYQDNEDDRVLGIQHADGQITAEYLRCRLLAGELDSQEFDEPNQLDVELPRQLDKRRYFAELKRLNNLLFLYVIIW